MFAQDLMVIDVFYKDKEPSQRALQKIDLVLEEYKDDHQINYHLIEADATQTKISEFGLPSTHFPVAVVIDGRFTAEIEGKIISFVHFPLFMKGIGRHEGNWSLSDLSEVLKDKSLLSEQNILPPIAEDNEDSECEN